MLIDYAGYDEVCSSDRIMADYIIIKTMTIFRVIATDTFDKKG